VVSIIPLTVDRLREFEPVAVLGVVVARPDALERSRARNINEESTPIIFSSFSYLKV